MSPRVSQREVILDAAEHVVRETGAGHLTLDAVAERAGVSKGGLIYHFPSKEALLTAMVARLLGRFEAERAQAAVSLGEGAAGGLRAYITSTLGTGEGFRRISAALLAAAANEPKLLEPVRQYYREWFAGLAAGEGSFERAAIVCLAVDGLWLLELLHLSPLSAGQRQGVVAALGRLAAGEGEGGGGEG